MRTALFLLMLIVFAMNPSARATPVNHSATQTYSMNAALNGTWEGPVQQVKGPGLSSADLPFPPFRIVIEDRHVHLFILESTGIVEATPGEFEIARSGTNGVIFGIQHDPDSPLAQSWVETWDLSITLKNENTLALTFVRIVNNNGETEDPPQGRFTIVRTGELRRVG